MGEGSYITLFSPSHATAFHRMKYGGGGVINPCFHRVTSLRFPEWQCVCGEGGGGQDVSRRSPNDATALAVDHFATVKKASFCIKALFLC